MDVASAAGIRPGAENRSSNCTAFTCSGMLSSENAIISPRFVADLDSASASSRSRAAYPHSDVAMRVITASEASESSYGILREHSSSEHRRSKEITLSSTRGERIASQPASYCANAHTKELSSDCKLAALGQKPLANAKPPYEASACGEKNDAFLVSLFRTKLLSSCCCQRRLPRSSRR